ncbi:uncharacterized protein [Physcomitrium patens]|uniref:RRP15-like protein n=1 Tax=Physcomitrium patens TaxID=3218 RepID=A0A2K1ILQ4_PHYPA|nr:RRP15-like protein [Physcomitrium patens]PNR30207.1 hypothetical protein PHYPA_026523 [Physcomitrium patens]|eukprot:XP_024361472.1 RRP15-like protein [Physcomitrella patens]
MAKKEEDETRTGKKRREMPAQVVESDDESEESDDDVMGDEFEGLAEELDSDEEDEVVGESDEEEDEDEDEEEMPEGVRRLMGRIMQRSSGKQLARKEAGMCSEESDMDSMEGSRSRSEEDLRDIGSARRLDDDDDTGDSAWKVTEVEAEGGGSGNPAPSSSLAADLVADTEKRDEIATGSGTSNFAPAEGSDGKEDESEGEDVMETDDEGEGEDNDEGEVGSQSEEEASVSLDGGSDSEAGSDGKDDATKSSAYSRAFSKILQSKAAKESDTGPVLAARQTLVARKLNEEAEDTKEKKESKKEKRELREKAHLIPQTYANTKEKELVKLATRGVVKLFNAVSKAQKVQASGDGRDAKVVAKQSKSVFLAEVRGNSSSAGVGSKRGLLSSSTQPFKFGAVEAQNQPTSRWSVVKDDFMLGKQKLKDWDKDEEMGDATEV